MAYAKQAAIGCCVGWIYTLRLRQANNNNMHWPTVSLGAKQISAMLAKYTVTGLVLYHASMYT